MGENHVTSGSAAGAPSLDSVTRNLGPLFLRNYQGSPAMRRPLIPSRFIQASNTTLPVPAHAMHNMAFEAWFERLWSFHIVIFDGLTQEHPCPRLVPPQHESSTKPEPPSCCAVRRCHSVASPSRSWHTRILVNPPDLRRHLGLRALPYLVEAVPRLNVGLGSVPYPGYSVPAPDASLTPTSKDDQGKS